MSIARLSFLLGFVAAASASARTVLILSTGNATENALLKAAYSLRGDTVNIGPQPQALTSSFSLAGYNTVLLLPNYNRTAGDMPASGQTSLKTFYTTGGRLVTGEWTGWKAAGGQYQTIAPDFPFAPSLNTRAVSTITYSAVNFRAEFNAGLPDVFAFNPGNISGSEAANMQIGNAAFHFESDYGTTVSGLASKSVGTGEIVSFSNVIATNAVLDQYMRRLLGNVLGVQTSPVGDMNGDGVTDVADLGILAANFRTTVTTPGLGGDLNADGVVDVADLGLLAANFRLSYASFNALSATFGLPSVPEPASITLFAAPLMAMRRRSRVR